jgi:hypothetical protein
MAERRLGHRVRPDLDPFAVAARRPGGSIAAVLGVPGVIVGAAIIKFAVLPALTRSRPSASPSAFTLYRSALRWPKAGIPQPPPSSLHERQFHAAPGADNPMGYDTAKFYNTALAVIVGCVGAPVAFLLLPTLPPDVRRQQICFAWCRTVCDRARSVL